LPDFALQRGIRRKNHRVGMNTGSQKARSLWRFPVVHPWKHGGDRQRLFSCTYRIRLVGIGTGEQATGGWVMPHGTDALQLTRTARAPVRTIW